MKDTQHDVVLHHHKEGSIRHAEKRRTGTCQFADRVARISMDAYRSSVPQQSNGAQQQHQQEHTCLATIVAHFPTLPPNDTPISQRSEEEITQTVGDDTIHHGGYLQVMGLGVGTKFLSESILQQELKSCSDNDDSSKDAVTTTSSSSSSPSSLAPSNNRLGYGTRIRDCHAEVLARRAFRRQLSMEMLTAVRTHTTNETCKTVDTDPGKEKVTSDVYRPILQRIDNRRRATTGSKVAENTNDEEGGGNMKDGPLFELRPGVTLHMYTSSAPCGNATIKKFAKMKREVFDSTLGPDEWPCGTSHEMIAPHSLRLGQFALLVKRDATAANDDTISDPPPATIIKTNKKWPIRDSDEWCPPGTSIPGFQRGSIHSCSDKICRWNCLGLQGSLLSSVLGQPLYMSTLTVGRKMTECICRRAVCCRAKGFGDGSPCSKPKKGDASENQSAQANNEHMEAPKKASMYRLNHPSLMGTSVYMNESGVLDMSGVTSEGQDARFTSNLCWIWYPERGNTHNNHEFTTTNFATAECINGETGYVHNFSNGKKRSFESSACCELPPISECSTLGLLRAHEQIMTSSGMSISSSDGTAKTHDGGMVGRKRQMSLTELRALKREVATKYETAKEEFFTHRTFRQWKRREVQQQP